MDKLVYIEYLKQPSESPVKAVFTRSNKLDSYLTK